MKPEEIKAGDKFFAIDIDYGIRTDAAVPHKGKVTVCIAEVYSVGKVLAKIFDPTRPHRVGDSGKFRSHATGSSFGYVRQKSRAALASYATTERGAVTKAKEALARDAHRLRAELVEINKKTKVLDAWAVRLK